MSTARVSTLSHTTAELPSACPVPATGRRHWVYPVLLAGILLLGSSLRLWNIRAPFETADQATIPNMVRHSYGLKWIISHHYGLTLPLVQRTFAEVLWRMGCSLSEATDRLPLVLMSFGQIVATYFLVRRLGRTQVESCLCSLFCAILPALVADAYCPWAYRTPWLLAGTIALWATLAYQDDRRPWHLALAGASLMFHCLSCLYSFALPLAVMGAWWLRWRRPSVRQEQDRHGCSVIPAACLGFVLPCLLTLAIIGTIWWQTGEGQIAHLLTKRGMGTFGIQYQQIIRLPSEWVQQFGMVFGALAAVGMLAGLKPILRGERAGLISIWAWTALLPIVLLTDWSTTGYGANYLLLESAYTAGLSAMLLIRIPGRGESEVHMKPSGGYRGYGRPGIAIIGVLSFAQLLLGSIDAIVPHTNLRDYTGITPGWGRVHRDTGVKAAGWYVRRYVPMDAIILCVHDNKGMEVPVAEYYLGRYVLADYDIRPTMAAPILNAMHKEIDVMVVDTASESLVAALPDFERVAGFRDQQQEVRFIYARPAMDLPHVRADMQDINVEYDQAYSTRKVPQPRPSATDFDRHLSKYHSLLRQLRASVR